MKWLKTPMTCYQKKCSVNDNDSFNHDNMKMERNYENYKASIKDSKQDQTERDCEQESRNLKLKTKSRLPFILMNLISSKFDSTDCPG